MLVPNISMKLPPSCLKGIALKMNMDQEKCIMTLMVVYYTYQGHARRWDLFRRVWFQVASNV